MKMAIAAPKDEREEEQDVEHLVSNRVADGVLGDGSDRERVQRPSSRLLGALS